MTELAILTIFALTFAYGWFLRGKHTPRQRDGMNEYKRKFLLLYVRTEIKRFNKKNKITNRKEQIAFLNKKAVPTGNDGTWEIYRTQRDRLTRLMKLEYSLKTINKSFGEDMTHDKTNVRNYSARWLEPTREQYAKWGAVAKETPLPKLNIEPLSPTLKYWSKTISGKTEYMTDTDYQALRKSAGLPPLEHGLSTPAYIQDELDREYLEQHGRNSK